MALLDESYFPKDTGALGNAALGVRSFLNLLGGRVVSPSDLQREDQFYGAMDNAKLNYLQQQGDYYKMHNLEAQQRLEQQKAAAEQAQRQQLMQQQYLGSLRRPSPGVSPDMALMQGAQSGDVGPTISNQMRIAAPDPGRQFNPLEALQSGFDMKTAQELAGMNNWGRAKVSHFQDTRGPNGVQVTGFNEYGDAVQTGQTPFKAPEKLDLGGSVQLYDPITGEVNGRFGKSMTPGEAASNAVAWANYGLSKQNADKPQIVQTDGGPLLVDVKTGAGRSVVGPDGLPIQSTKPLTESQGKSVMFGTRAKAADEILTRLDSKINTLGLSTKQGAEGIWGVGGILGNIGNTMLSTDQQMVDQAQRDFVNATLRQESGAAIPPSEFDNARKQYFPQPGDSAEVIAQKRLNRQNVINGFSAMAGSGAKSMVPASNKAASQPAPSNSGSQQPKSKFFNVGGKQLIGQLGADGSYYVNQGGKRYRIEE